MDREGSNTIRGYFSLNFHAINTARGYVQKKMRKVYTKAVEPPSKAMSDSGTRIIQGTRRITQMTNKTFPAPWGETFTNPPLLSECFKDKPFVNPLCGGCHRRQ